MLLFTPQLKPPSGHSSSESSRPRRAPIVPIHAADGRVAPEFFGRESSQHTQSNARRRKRPASNYSVFCKLSQECDLAALIPQWNSCDCLAPTSPIQVQFLASGKSGSPAGFKVLGGASLVVCRDLGTVTVTLMSIAAHSNDVRSGARHVLETGRDSVT